MSSVISHWHMQYKKLLILAIFICTGFNPFAQKSTADSLLQIINSAGNIEEKTENLNKLGKFYRINKTDSALKYISLAQELAEKHQLTFQLTDSYNELAVIWSSKKEKDSARFYLDKAYHLAAVNKDYRGRLRSLNSIGLLQYRDKDYDNALTTYNEALLYSDKIEDKKLLSMLYNNIAMLYKANGNVESALEYYHKALAISEELNEMRGIGIITSNIGLLYENQDKTDLALQYLNRSLKIRQETGNRSGESYVLNNLGLVYENIKEYDKAMDHYKRALEIKKELKQNASIAIMYNNLGIIFKKKSMYDSALYYSNKSLVLRLQLKDKPGEARTRVNIGQVYLLQGKNGEAKYELEKALSLAADHKNHSVLQNIHTSLYQVLLAQEDYKNAIVHLEKSKAFKDSIFNIEKEKSIAEIESRYNALKKEKENLVLVQENKLKDEKIERQIIVGTGLMALVILFVLLLILTYRAKNKIANKKVEIEKQTVELNRAYTELKQLSEFKESMTNMLVHDLKNPLNIILSAKELRGLPHIDDLLELAGSNMKNLVHNILDVYKYQDSKMELHKNIISIHDAITVALKELSYLTTEKKQSIDFRYTEDYHVEADNEILRRVFVNLFSNAIKFTPENGIITVTIQLENQKTVRIGIANSGPGIPNEKQEVIFEYFKQAEKPSREGMKSTGLGLTFCKMAIEAHNGEIGVISESETGVEFWFTLPGVKGSAKLDINKPDTSSLIETNKN